MAWQNDRSGVTGGYASSTYLPRDGSGSMEKDLVFDSVAREVDFNGNVQIYAGAAAAGYKTTRPQQASAKKVELTFSGVTFTDEDNNTALMDRAGMRALTRAGNADAYHTH